MQYVINGQFFLKFFLLTCVGVNQMFDFQNCEVSSISTLSVRDFQSKTLKLIKSEPGGSSGPITRAFIFFKSIFFYFYSYCHCRLCQRMHFQSVEDLLISKFI